MLYTNLVYSSLLHSNLRYHIVSMLYSLCAELNHYTLSHVSNYRDGCLGKHAWARVVGGSVSICVYTYICTYVCMISLTNTL